MDVQDIINTVISEGTKQASVNFSLIASELIDTTKTALASKTKEIQQLQDGTLDAAEFSSLMNMDKALFKRELVKSEAIAAINVDKTIDTWLGIIIQQVLKAIMV